MCAYFSNLWPEYRKRENSLENLIKLMTIQSYKNSPFYIKLPAVLISLIAIGYLAVLGKEVLSPLILATLFAILVLPLANFFERKLKMRRSAASFFSLITIIVCVGFVLYLLGAQLSKLVQDWPLFKEQVTNTFINLRHWISDKFNLDTQKQMTYVDNATSKLLSSGTAVLGTTVLSVSSIVLFLVFVMIYTFFLLFYRRLIVKFLVNVFKEENKLTVLEIIEQVQYIIRKYVAGLLLEMSIVASVCCITFWILGIKYAILLGLVVGIFNIIPYIGIFSALLLSSLITFATAAVATKVILVAVTIICVHLVDSNFLLPFIVGSKVRINALITLIGVIIGEMMWGISGMFFSIPVIAIMKIVFDRVEDLKPWGQLLGDEPDEKKPKPLKKQVKKAQTKKE